jgi:hypothetical protein
MGASELRWVDIPGQVLVPLGPGIDVRVEVSERRALPALDADGERRWRKRCAENARLHDGEILAVRTIAEDGRIRCDVERFARLAVQDADYDLGVRLLGVKGLVIGRDARGGEHVLIARRGPHVRVFADMWEIAPAGGVDVPSAAPVALGHDAIERTLRTEWGEEVGGELDGAVVGSVAIVRDEIARSVEIIVRVEWQPTIESPRLVDGRNWEYRDVRWLPLTEAERFYAEHAPEIVGPMRAVFRWMRWT